MSVLWSENGQKWERKYSRGYSDKYSQKPGMFRSWKMFWLAFVCLAAAGWLFVMLVRSL